MKYGVENLVYDIVTLMKAQLNTYIAQVEADRVAQGLPVTSLQQINTTSGYFKQTWTNEILNVSPAMFYGVEQSDKVEGLGPVTLKQYEIFCEVVYNDSMGDRLAIDRMFRYIDALEALFSDNFDKIRGSSKILIKTVTPFSFKIDFNSSEDTFVAGVHLITSLA